MDIESVLDEILKAAKKDGKVLSALLKTEEDPNPVSAFCALAGQMGFPVSEMDLIYAGEEAYAAMEEEAEEAWEKRKPRIVRENLFIVLYKLDGVVHFAKAEIQPSITAEMTVGSHTQVQ